MNEYARVERFKAVLGDLKPPAQFKVEDVDTIEIKRYCTTVSEATIRV